MAKVLGADPQILLITKNGDLKFAESVVTCTAFGYDGAAIAAELRPEPADTPNEAFANIRGALSLGMETPAGKYQWFAGTGNGHHPTGGHIHIGNRTDAILPSLFDVYLGLPLIALEPEDGRWYRRDEGGYGHWGDVRGQPWGIEYRTPSSWLVSPAATRLAMSLAWLIYQDPDSMTLPAWNRELRDYNLLNGETNKLRKYATEALGLLRNCPNYKTVAPAIEAYHFMADVLGDWQEQRDMRVTWGFRDPPTGTGIIRETQAEQEQNDDVGTSIKWNDDQYMGMVERRCGPVASPDGRTMWAVGARGSRGTNVLLSPELNKNPRVKAILNKYNFPYQTWPNFPSQKGELVIGLPLNLRMDSADNCGRVVRQVALSAFSRLGS